MPDRFCTLFLAPLAAMAALHVIPVAAQDYSAGKTAVQLFQSDCTACHKTPAGLAKGMDARARTGFLREHYTTRTESAAALAAYLASGAGGSAEPKQKGQAAPAEPGTGTGPKPPRSAARPAEGEPKPRMSAEPATAPAEDNESGTRTARPSTPPHEGVKPHEGIRPQHEGTKGDEATVRKLESYAAAGGEAKDTKPESVKTLESYANAGSPAGAIVPADGATATKPKPPEKKKKNSSSAAPSAAPASGPASPAAAPGWHASPQRRPAAAGTERRTGDN